MIQKIAIQNYRRFKEFHLDFESGMNIVVGDNDSGKSSLLEAINLALTGRVQGWPLSQDFSPFLVNQGATAEYVQALHDADGSIPAPPEVIIDLFLEASDDTEILRGRDNLLDKDACGVRIWGYLNPEYLAEYQAFASQPDQVYLVPTEYYRVDWLGFSGNAVTARSIPATASVIDPTTIRLQSGADHHLQQIIHTHLDPSERVELSRAYRSLREEFTKNPSVEAINEKLSGEDGDVTDKELTLSIDISRRFTWESSLVPHLDELPFPFIGKGEQNAVKTLLAIGRKAEDAHIVLIEEPENHLSFSSMRRLISKIEAQCEGKQVIIATHSSFVLNKLGLDRLVLLTEKAAARITDLPADTTEYFKKLSGYDTLRLVLAKRAILVEGPSDELVVQRAYVDTHGCLPIEDGIDVINVRGLSFKRFLDLAVELGCDVSVVTDNDGKPVDDVLARYADYVDHENVSIWVADDPNRRTLEPQLVAMNSLEVLNQILGKTYETADDLVKYMLDNKTASALAIFEADETIEMPEYIRGAVA
ncbi:MAG: AAA family ATPase [Actinobacteria bacterium]|nr:AAA family ATPase [Actinomycetota bacterium]